MLIGKLTMAFLTSQSWHILKSWYTVGGSEQGFWCCFADGLNQSLVCLTGTGYYFSNVQRLILVLTQYTNACVKTMKLTLDFHHQEKKNFDFFFFDKT